jgi:two-component system, OmpR family, response regulator MprA
MNGKMAAPPKVAVVDDERHVREMLELGLAREGYAVRCAADGAQALDLVGEWQPDIVILDVMLPKIDGVTLLPMLRKKTEAPIIMLTAKGGVPDKIAALVRGADDYLAKPFVFEELLARLTAALRRPRLAGSDVLRYVDLTINLETREVTRGDRQIGLTPREFDLLVALARTPRRVLTKEQLLQQVWGHDFEGEVGIVETYISYLRAKVDAGSPKRIIHTVRGVGYALREDAPA